MFMSENQIQIDRLLEAAIKQGASDIHLKVGSRPTLRINGHLNSLDTLVLQEEHMPQIIKGILSESKQITYGKTKNVDASLQQKSSDDKIHNFRVNVAEDFNGPYITMRVVPEEIMDVTKIGFPYDLWKDVINLKQGLVLVTGITGSGKTTTLASLVNQINKTRSERIITLEDPVEYIYPQGKSFISQREVGSNLGSFGDGVKYALRQDPDVLLVGEIRDRETALKTLEATATGHLVFSTLHTINASETVRRYVNLFETDDHDNIRDSLASHLAYVFSQQLIPYHKGQGRTLAMEVMNVQSDPAVKNHLRNGEYHKIVNDLQSGKKHKMLTMDQHLGELIESKRLLAKEALPYAHDKKAFGDKYGYS